MNIDLPSLQQFSIGKSCCNYDIIDIKFLKVLKLAPKDDLIVLGVVFALTVFYNLIVAVGVGITLASLLYAKRVADRAKLVNRKVYGDDTMRIEKVLEKTFCCENFE